MDKHSYRIVKAKRKKKMRKSKTIVGNIKFWMRVNWNVGSNCIKSRRIVLFEKWKIRVWHFLLWKLTHFPFNISYLLLSIDWFENSKFNWMKWQSKRFLIQTTDVYSLFWSTYVPMICLYILNQTTSNNKRIQNRIHCSVCVR